ncbi:hypothetical protein, partial [Burkholderia ubonensis]|uniref:hypothetical protein n=1 Tax=Burkholderia ubonensis TaxID=101571 RepID=UPI0039F52A0B
VPLSVQEIRRLMCRLLWRGAYSVECVLAWSISKDVAGVDSTTTHHCALLPMGFLLLNALYKAAVKKLRDRQSICLTFGLRATRVLSAQRHVADSITTLRWRIAAYIARRLQRCPFCSTSNADLLAQ